MSRQKFRIFPLGDSALTVDFGNTISADLNQMAISLAAHFEQCPFPGFIEAVPAYASASVFYDLIEVRRNFPDFDTAFDAVRSIVAEIADNIAAAGPHDVRTIDIPLVFNAESSPDLEFIAETNGLSTGEVIDIFTSRTYRVYMLGFLPGFTYMGEVDERIATPRKESPRTLVPKGSVGIAGSQTGIYSLNSPGGWQIIGRTDVEMFTPEAENPTCLQPGDEVKFVAAL